MKPTPARLSLRALATLLLAILFAQALPAQAISLDRGRGPVFSAATAEVTLPPREDGAAVVRTIQVPWPDRVATSASVTLVTIDRIDSTKASAWPANRQRGPPLRPPPRSLASPREPPFLS